METFRDQALRQINAVEAVSEILGILNKPEIEWSAAARLTDELIADLTQFDVFREVGPGKPYSYDSLDHLLTLMRFLNNDLSPRIRNRRSAIHHAEAAVKVCRHRFEVA